MYMITKKKLDKLKKKKKKLRALHANARSGVMAMENQRLHIAHAANDGGWGKIAHHCTSNYTIVSGNGAIHIIT